MANNSYHQKRKIMTGMPVRAAKVKLLEIFAEAEPGVDFAAKYPRVWPWMEAWFRLRSRNETLDAMCQAFAEKVARLHKEKNILAQRIHTQRLEIGKRLDEVDALKFPKPGHITPAGYDVRKCIEGTCDHEQARAKVEELKRAGKLHLLAGRLIDLVEADRAKGADRPSGELYQQISELIDEYAVEFGNAQSAHD